MHGGGGGGGGEGGVLQTGQNDGQMISFIICALHCHAFVRMSAPVYSSFCTYDSCII